MRRRAAVAALVVAGAVTVMAGPAGADPDNAPRALEITANCGGVPFAVVVNGAGRWTPAHAADSTNVFIPVAFGPTTITFTPTGGSPLPSQVEPAVSKGRTSAPGDRELIQCSYSFVEQLPDGVVQVTGTVQGWNAQRA